MLGRGTALGSPQVLVDDHNIRAACMNVRTAGRRTSGAGAARSSRASRYTTAHTSQGRGPIISVDREAPRRRIRISLEHSHSVWGRVVPDIPDFCRELVSALADE